MCILRGLHDFPKRFINRHYMVETFDDEDLQAWEFQTRRWARVLFPYIKEEQHLDPIFMVGIIVLFQLVLICQMHLILF